MPASVHWSLARAIQGAVPTRQTSSSGRSKSPRIQVVLPEDLCARLADLADAESRTVSNMAKVLIQQGVERLERQRAGQAEPLPSPQAIGPAASTLPATTTTTTTTTTTSTPAPTPTPATATAAASDAASDAARTDALRQALEQQEVARPQRRGPRRLRLQRPIV